MRWIAIAVLVLSAAGPARPSQYFVSHSGSNVGPGTSLERPWRTLAHANSRVVAGDTVSIRGGIYSESIAPARSGTESRRITYRAFSDEEVTLTGVYHGILMQDRAFVTVDGIDCRQTQTFLLIDNSHDIWIRNCVFDQAALHKGGPKGIRIVNNSHHNRIQRCWIGRAGYVAVDESSRTGLQDRGGLINIGNDVESNDDSHYNLIEDNILAYGSHHVLLLASSYNVIRNNTFHNEAWMADPTDPERKYGNRCIGGGGPNSSHNLIEYNRIAFAGPPPDDDGAYGIERASPANIYRYNSIYHNGTAGIGLHSKWHGTTSENHVYANTFYRNGENEEIEDFHKGGISIQNYNGVEPTGNVIRNNLFHRNITPDDRFHAQGVFAVGGNVRLEAQVVAGNWLEAGDPLFMDVSTSADPHSPNPPDFRLQASSPCIDAGTFLTRTRMSGRGRELPVEDVGYFSDGWGIVPGDDIQLEGSPVVVRVIHVDRDTKVLQLDGDLVWQDGQGVALPYAGLRPDVGAFEFGLR